MSNQKKSFSISGKGYYIALILCAVAIGISGYLYYANANEKPVEDVDATVSATDPVNNDVQAVATQPQNIAGSAPTETKPQLPKSMKTAAPVSGETVAVYAMDALSYNQTTRDWRTHNGIDIAADTGTQVCAAADGTVYTVFEDEALGTTVVIRHDNGYTTTYASLGAEVSVSPGDTVTVGQAIGCVGDSALLESAIGSHVHFSVSCNGVPVDPAEFLGR